MNSLLARLNTLILAGFLLAITLNGYAQPPGQGSGGGRPQQQTSDDNSPGLREMGDAIIEFDEETGSIMIISDEETNREIAKVIESLDRPVPQVLIKVLFLEVTHADGLDVGVEGSFDFSTNEDIRSILTNFDVADQTRGGFFSIVDDDFEMTLRALAIKSKLEVLSRPSVLTRNNNPATIIVGQEVPFIRNTRISDSGVTTNDIEYEDIGIILNVTPHISKDDIVEMEVIPEISTITGETIQISDTVDAPVIAKRSAETRVVVKSGQTVVIGGMMEDNVTETIQSVPILGDLPFIGALFRRTIKGKSKTELLIFLTPHVVRGTEELRQLSISENDKAEKAGDVFTEAQRDKYIDNLETNKEIPKKEERKKILR